MLSLKVLSLGWGVQSFTLAAMVALGELEPLDAAVHADTTHESNNTYTFAAQWTPWLVQHGVKVVTVVTSNPEPDPLNYYNRIAIPAFSSAGNGHSEAQLNRECTNNWKRRQIRRWLQANRNGQPIEQWIGISLDEVPRMKDSNVKYIVNRWPLIERRMTRVACITWLERHNLPIPSKSACYFCPFHNTAEWRNIKNSGNSDWQKAVKVDEAIRKMRPPYDLFLHPSRRPLTQVDFATPQEHGQLNLWNEECSGICGV